MAIDGLDGAPAGAGRTVAASGLADQCMLRSQGPAFDLVPDSMSSLGRRSRYLPVRPTLAQDVTGTLRISAVWHLPALLRARNTYSTPAG